MNGPKTISRRALVAGAASLVALRPVAVAAADGTLDERFDFLHTHGNSSCSGEFLNSIATMPEGARLQGSCCAEMERTRYKSQIAGLAQFSKIADIPPDPYDIDAALARKLLSSYDLALTPEEQKAYDYAMSNSDEKGPCCCRCWRWKVYGGLAKLLIRDHNFDGKQVTEVWNFSNGCGGAG